MSLIGSAPLLLTLQFGRVADSIQLMKDEFEILRIIADNPHSPGYSVIASLVPVFVPCVQHILGSSRAIQQTYDALGITFESVEDRLEEFTEPMRGANFTKMEQKEYVLSNRSDVPADADVALRPPLLIWKRCKQPWPCPILHADVGFPKTQQ